jgi:flagellin
MAVAMRNTQNATSMMQTAEGALGEATNILMRMKDLATQASDGSANLSDQKAMQGEYDALGTELTNIMGNTSFGGQKLMNSKATGTDIAAATAAKTTAATAATALSTTATASQTALTTAQATYGTTPTQANADALTAAQTQYDTDKLASDNAAAASTAAAAYETSTIAASSATGGKFSTALSFQIGASSSETMGLDISSTLSSTQNSLKAVSTNFNGFGVQTSLTGTELTGGTATGMIDKLSDALNSIGNLRSSLGAAANRLEHISTNLSNVSSNTQAATGRIMDVDFATESSNMTSSQMLLQAGTAMLKQSNGMSSMVMSLLQ